MPDSTPSLASPASIVVDYILLAGCVFILALEAFYLLTGDPGKYPTQHWRTFFMASAVSFSMLAKLSDRVLLKRTFQVISVSSVMAVFVLIFR
jgi:hypothetical protein